MVVYRLSSNYLFVCPASEKTVFIYEYYCITNTIISGSHFKLLCEVGNQKEYDALEIFGTEIRGDKLECLATVLCQTFVDVNREGVCYLFIRNLQGIGQNIRSTAYRLNDIFDWSVYGVKSQIATVWNRRGLPSDVTIVDHEDEKKSLEKAQIELKQKENENSNLKNKLSSCKQQSQEKEKALQEALKELSDAESELKSVKSELASVKEASKVEIVDSENKKRSLKKEVRDLKNQLSNCNKQLHAKEEELTRLHSKFAELNYNNWQLLPKLLFVSCVASVAASVLLSLFLRKKT